MWPGYEATPATYCSEHYSEEEPPVPPHHDPAGGRVHWELSQAEQRTHEDSQEPRLQELRLPAWEHFKKKNK